jgi:hypothetical protein
MSAVASRWSALYADAHAARLHEARRLGCTTAVFGTTPQSEALYAPLGLTTEPDAPGRWFYLR